MHRAKRRTREESDFFLAIDLVNQEGFPQVATRATIERLVARKQIRILTEYGQEVLKWRHNSLSQINCPMSCADRSPDRELVPQSRNAAAEFLATAATPRAPVCIVI